MAAAVDINDQIMKILDEVQKPASRYIETSFHPSEVKNRKPTIKASLKLGKTQNDFFEIINSYHAYCKLCQHHFYTQSKLDDINSFFQNHINSVDHRSSTIINPCDSNKPIFVWNKWLYSGTCNICNIQDVTAYVKQVDASLADLIEKHSKGFRHQNKVLDYNAELPRHCQLIKKLSFIELFSKFIKNVDDVSECILCCKRLNGKKTVIKYHLNSSGHLEKLAQFIENKFSYSVQELLNGFNLEDLLRKALDQNDLASGLNGEIIDSEVDDDYLTDTDYESESERINFEGFGSEMKGFSPKQVEDLLKIHDIDFVSKDRCTLCDEVCRNVEEHLGSNSHKLRVFVFQQCGENYPTFELSNKSIYLINREKRLKKFENEIRQYNNIKKLLEENNLTYGVPYKPEYDDLKLEIFNETKNDVENQTKENDIGTENNSYSKYISENEDFLCTLCHVKCKTKNDAEVHLAGKRHLSNAELPDSVSNLENVPVNIYRETVSKKAPDNIYRDIVRKVIIDKTSFDSDCIKLLEGNSANCTVCGQIFKNVSTKEHLLGSRHQKEVEHRMRLRELARDPKFVDPIQKWVKMNWVCMICTCSIHKNSLYSHIEGRHHYLSYERSKEVDADPLILSMYVVAENEIHCRKCGSSICLINKDVSKRKKLKDMLDSMKAHWPCKQIKQNGSAEKPKLLNGENSANLCDTLENIYKVNQTVVAKNKRIAQAKSMSVPCEKCGVPYKQEEIETHTAQCSRTQGVDIVMIQNKFQEIFNLFKNDIVRNVNQKMNSIDNNSETSSDRSRTCSESTPASSRHCSESSGSPTSLQPPPNNKVNQQEKKGKLWRDRKNETEKKNELVIDHYFCFICREKGPIEFMDEHINTREHTIKELQVMNYGPIRTRCCDTCGIMMIGTGRRLRDHFKSREHLINQDAEMQRRMDEKLNDMSTVDVLIVSDLPKTENKYEALLVIFKKFGTVKHIKMDRVKAVLEFIEPGAIQRALHSQPILMFGKPLTLTCAKQKGTPRYFLHDVMIKLLSNPQLLVEHALHLEKIANAIMESPEERVRENRVYKTLSKALQSTYPDCKCYPFGSRYSGLTLDNSDFDIFLDCGNLYSGLTKQEPRYQEDIVRKVARALKGNADCSDINCVPRARVPIISFLHKPTNLHCDVSFKNGLSCQNTKLIKFMVSFDPRVKPFVLFLKDWVDLNQLHGPPLFSSYAVTMLVIYYLEQLENPVLPTVELLQQLHTGSRTTIGGWDCSFGTSLHGIGKFQNYKSLPELILGFFEFYARFNYSEYVISPLTGKPLLRSSIEHMLKEPLPMPYKRQMSNIPIENFARRTYPICIMDPFDLSHNLTKSFPKLGLELFIYFCEASAKLLQSALDNYPNLS